MVDFEALRAKLSSPTGVLKAGTEPYSEAVFIGNLNYRMTMPAIVVQARNIEDVQTTINFARQHHVRLTVKNGGHSYMGYCLNEGGIVLDLRYMNECSIDLENMTATLEGGATWKEAYYKLLERDPRNIIIGGQCPTVGVSGFTLGGGISPFSRSYGLACDNLLEATMVTCEGRVVTVSPHDREEHNRDLFWALTGAGGGNFGVVVSLTFRVYKLKDPDGTVVCGQVRWNLPQQTDEFNKMMNEFNTNKCPDELTADALWTHGPQKQLTGGMTIIYNGAWDAAQKVLEPFLDFKPKVNTLKAMKWTDWVQWAEGWDTFSQVYHHHASFIFAEGAVTQTLNTKISNLVAEAVTLLGITDDNKVNDPKCHILWDHIGGATARVSPQDSAFFWRQGDYVATIKVQWTNPDQGPRMVAFIAHCQSVLLPYAIEQKAAYINYIDGTCPNWEEAYYGDNYARLQRIKSKWDPEDFFRNMQSIRPLGDGATSTAVHTTPSVPSEEAILDAPEVKQVEQWWEKYAPLEQSALLGTPETQRDVFQRDCAIRNISLANRVADGPTE